MATSEYIFRFTQNAFAEFNPEIITNEISNQIIEVAREKSYSVEKIEKGKITIYTGFFRGNDTTLYVVYDETKIHVIGAVTHLMDLFLAKRCRKFGERVGEKVIDILNEKITNIIDGNQKIINNALENKKVIIKDTTIYKLLLDNQSEIESSVLKNFIKIYGFYAKHVDWYNTMKENLENINFSVLPREIIESTTETFKAYPDAIELFYYLFESTVNAYLKKENVVFFTLYNQFEDLGIFMSKAEKLIIKNLNDINNNLYEIFSNIDLMIENVSDIANNINSNLDLINNNIKFMTILQGINTYQLHKK